MEYLQRYAIIGLINLFVYYKTLFYGYVGDDVERSERKEPEFKNRFHRIWLQYIGLRHTNSMQAHFFTLITHTLCCMLIYPAFGSNDVSFLASVLFSINPVNIQGSVWISGRNYVTSAILALLMLILPKFSIIPYAMTSYFAVNTWFAPLAFLGTPNWKMIWIIPFVWIFTKNNKETIHRKLWETGGLKTTNKEMRAVHIGKIMPFLKTYLYYFCLCIFPFRVGIEHNFLRGFGTNKTDNKIGYRFDRFFYAGLILFSGVCYLCWQGLTTGWTPVTYGLFWFTLNIAMWCNFVTYQQHIAERYAYFANIGMMLALAGLLINYSIIYSFLIGAYLVRLWYVMDMYLNDYWAVEHSIVDSKKLYYMWLMRGVKKFMIKDYLGALYDFNEANLHKNYDLKILFNLTSTYFLLGDVVKAREFLEKTKNNIYDELEDVVKPCLEKLEALIKTVEEAKARGESQVQVDLSSVMVVK